MRRYLADIIKYLTVVYGGNKGNEYSEECRAKCVNFET